MSVRSAVVRLSAEVSGLLRGYGQAEAATKSLTASGVAMSAKHKEAINTVSRGFGIMGAAAAAGVGIVIKQAADFDQKMSLVKAVTGEGADGMLRLRDAAIKAGAATKYSAGEAADGISELAKAGISTADILHGGLNGALSLASAGELSVASAAQDMATALTQFHLKGTAASHVADLLAAGANKAQGEVGDLAYALNYAGLPAHAMGVSLNQTVGTLALFAKNGLLGSQAGTTLRGILSSLASPSKKAAEEMQSLGINVFDAHGKFIGMNGVAQVLHDRLSGLTQQQRQYALGVIFSNAQLQGANILYQNGAAGVDTWTKKVNDSGAAARVSAEKMNNLSGDIEQLKGSLQTALIGAGEGAQSPLRGITQDLTKLVNRFNTLPPAAQSNVTKTVAAIAGLGLAGFAIGKTVVGINNATQALKELGVTGGGLKAAAWPVALAVALDQGRSHLADWARGFDDAAPSVQALTTDLQAFRRSGDLSFLSTDVGGLPKLFDAASSSIGNAAQRTQNLFGGIPVIGGSIRDQIDLIDQATGHSVSNLRTAQKTFANLDTALTNLAQTSPRAAHQMFAPIREEAKQAGYSMKQLMQLFPEYYALLGRGKDAKTSLIDVGGMLNGLTHLRDYRSQLMKLPRQVLTQVVSPTALTTTRQVEHLARQYKLTPHQVETIMRARDFAGPQIQKVLKELGMVDHKHPTSKLDADPSAAHGHWRTTMDELTELGHQHPMATLDANFHPAASAIQVALHSLGIFDGKKATATLDANNGPLDAAVAQAQARINSLHGTTVTDYVTTVHRAGGPQPTTQATGGYIRGPGTTTSDSIPALLSDQEYVVKAAAVNYYGVDFFHKANSMALRGGGFVSRSASGDGPSGRGGWPSEFACSISIPELGIRSLRTTMRAVAREEYDDAASFDRTERGRRS